MAKATTPKLADARATVRTAIVSGLSARARLTGMRAGPEADMLREDLLASVFAPDVAWAAEMLARRARGKPAPPPDEVRRAAETVARLLDLADARSGPLCERLTRDQWDTIGRACRRIARAART